MWGLLFCLGGGPAEERETVLLRDGWRFIRADNESFGGVQVDDGKWKRVSVPHDWAISGPFDANNDRQFMAIEQDGQKEAQKPVRTYGRTAFRRRRLVQAVFRMYPVLGQTNAWC